MSEYAGTDLGRVPSKGGSVRMTLASSVAQGNGGTSLPCKRVLLITNGTDVRVQIGVACTATTGIPVPTEDGTIHMNALELAIDDVSSLYFYGTTGKYIDCLYSR